MSGYDLVVDIAGTRSAAAARRVLKRRGVYIVVGGKAGQWVQPAGHVFATLALGPFVPQRMALADMVAHTGKRDLLAELAKLIEGGQIRPVIDRRYTFDQIPEAVRYQEGGHAAGKVVVSF